MRKLLSYGDPLSVLYVADINGVFHFSMTSDLKNTSVFLKMSHGPSYELMRARESAYEGKKPNSHKQEKLGSFF